MTATISVNTLKQYKTEGNKIACLTAYDASFAKLLDEAGVDVLLVGDSLGMVVQGKETTLPVTVDEMIYHTSLVRRGAPAAFIIVDMPFMSYATPELALENAGRLMKETGAQMVKLEGGAVMVETVRTLAQHSIPVCAHLGLLPQSVHKLGGYHVQGREEQAAKAILEDALALEEAGADVLILECVPTELARQITHALKISTIGIGAGPDCDGQVLVLYDMLAITPGKRPRFTKDFLQDSGSIPQAIRAFVDAVKTGSFPESEHSFFNQ
jgi:3-methyl-2-oxobutanoate hydroxymethyltransferase